jgi:membrane protein implicated in regulation of membrane protease activity
MWWLIASAGLGLVMLVTTLPEFGMFAAGGVAAAATSALGGGPVPQFVVFLVVSIALVSVVRGVALRHRTTPPTLRTGIDALKGRQAVVLERVDGHTGRIKLAGEIWSARALDTDQVYEAGQQVDVVDIEGATAVVM